MQDENNNESSKPWLGIIFLLWFLGSIAGLVISAKMGMTGLLLAIFGQYFAFFGFMIFGSELKVFLKRDKNKETKWAPLLISGVLATGGIIIVSLGLLLQFGTEDIRELVGALFPVLGVALFVFIGIGFLVAAFTKRRYSKAHMTHELEAKCVKIDSRISRNSGGHEGHSRTVYAPVWEYYYNGQTYQNHHPVWSNICQYKLGDIKMIKINPEHPDEMDAGISEVMMYLIMGLSFTGFGGLALYFAILQFFY